MTSDPGRTRRSTDAPRIRGTGIGTGLDRSAVREVIRHRIWRELDRGMRLRVAATLALLALTSISAALAPIVFARLLDRWHPPPLPHRRLRSRSAPWSPATRWPCSWAGSRASSGPSPSARSSSGS
jgi:hypothetical protein